MHPVVNMHYNKGITKTLMHGLKWTAAFIKCTILVHNSYVVLEIYPDSSLCIGSSYEKFDFVSFKYGVNVGYTVQYSKYVLSRLMIGMQYEKYL